MEKLELDILESNYYDKKKESVIIKLTADDIIKMEHKFYQLNKDLDDKLQLVADVKDLLIVDGDAEEIRSSIMSLIEEAELCDDGITTLKKQIAETLKDIKNGYIENTTVVYYIDDQDKGMMHLYLASGDYYMGRDLLKEEKQTKLKIAVNE